MSVERSGQVGEKELAEPLGLEAAGRIFLVIADLRLNLALHAVIREHNAPDRVPSPQPRERRARCGVLRWVRADDLDPSRDLRIGQHQYHRWPHSGCERDGCKKGA